MVKKVADEVRNLNSHSAAVAKYNANNYKTFSVNLKKDEYEILAYVLGCTNQSKSGFMRAALKYADENAEFMEYLKHVDET